MANGTAETWDLAIDRMVREANAVARLSQTRIEDDAKAMADGRELGRSWANDDARYYELRHLAKYDGDAAANLFDAIGGGDGHYEQCFWETAFGDGWSRAQVDESLCRGFVQGALEVWGRVKDKI